MAKGWIECGNPVYKRSKSRREAINSDKKFRRLINRTVKMDSKNFSDILKEDEAWFIKEKERKTKAATAK